ncbi:MAG TPA: hypothetical protein VIF12_08610, partial [Micavibrio sp.]
MGFGVIILALLLLVGSSFLGREKDILLKKEGAYHLVPSRAARIQACGLALMVLVICYAISQTGYCATMTPLENERNRQIGLLLAAVFCLLLIVYLYKLFLVRFSFDMEKLTVQSPAGRRQFLWKDFKNTGFSFGQPCLEFVRKKVTFPYCLLGLLQLQEFINAKLFS